MPRYIHDIDGVPWFIERDSSTFPGQGFALEVAEILHEEQLEFQHILIFRLTTYGNVLVLNGIVQCTERDEFAYQELITHVAMMAHPQPKKVLVIGGGDCGVLREVVKHSDVIDSVTMVEIDPSVIKLLQKYLPQMTTAIDHPKATITITDGFKFLQLASGQNYDVIITDLLDPEGPAMEFFETLYFSLLKQALSPQGVVIMQLSENVWLNLAYLKQLTDKARLVFANVAYCQCYMPSYTGGQLGLVVALPSTDIDLRQPQRPLPQHQTFKYYSPQMHRASFVLPTWAAAELHTTTNNV